MPKNSTPAPDGNDLLTDQQMSSLFGVHSKFWAKARMRGDGPIFIKVGASVVRYRRADVDDWIERRKRSSTVDPGPDPVV